MSTVAEVSLWGRVIGAVSVDKPDGVAAFEYHPEFVGSGIEVAPITMPLARRIYQFPGLPHSAFHGLPGMLADALPDKFGNALIDRWLAEQGRPKESFDIVERLCYVGTRAMGALEFKPTMGPSGAATKPLDVGALVELASLVLDQRSGVSGALTEDSGGVLNDILRVGTSAGGARAKAVVAWNRTTGELRSGQATLPRGFEHWLLKFDGVTDNRDRELADSAGFGAVEYAYSLMARAGGIVMTETHLLEEGQRRHFMTKRFDREPDGGKLHMQSLAALAHFDFNAAGAYSYEQAFQVCRQLGLGADAREQLFRRMAFNVLARNQDDHVKNIAFLMDKSGQWSLAPAFDLTYAWNPDGMWTASHQMTINAKRDDFVVEDLMAVARSVPIQGSIARRIISEVEVAVGNWQEFADEARVDPDLVGKIAAGHR